MGLMYISNLKFNNHVATQSVIWIYLFNFSVPLPAISMMLLLCRSSCGVSAYVTTSHTNTPKDLHIKFKQIATAQKWLAIYHGYIKKFWQ